MNADLRNSPPPLSDVLQRWAEIAEAWDVRPEERSALVGGSCHMVEGEIATYALLCGEQRIRLLVEVAPVFRRIVGDDDLISNWLRLPNPNLAGRKPIDVMIGSPEWMGWLVANLGGAA